MSAFFTKKFHENRNVTNGESAALVCWHAAPCPVLQSEAIVCSATCASSTTGTTLWWWMRFPCPAWSRSRRRLRGCRRHRGCCCRRCRGPCGACGSRCRSRTRSPRRPWCCLCPVSDPRSSAPVLLCALHCRALRSPGIPLESRGVKPWCSAVVFLALQTQGNWAGSGVGDLPAHLSGLDWSLAITSQGFSS